MTQAKILDVSHWVRPDWQAWLAAGYSGVYMKVAEGRSWEDNYWKQHYADAEGFYKGPYLFFHGYRSGLEQASWFFGKARVEQWDMKPVVDVEWYSGNRNADGSRRVSQREFASQLRACLTKVERDFGVRPMIYTSKTMWQFLIGYDPYFTKYDLWTAHYTMAAEPWIPIEWAVKGYQLWQFIDRPIDQNRFAGDKLAYLAWMGKEVVTLPGPQVLAPGIYEVR